MLPADAGLYYWIGGRGQVFAAAAHVGVRLAGEVAHVRHVLRPPLSLGFACLADVRTGVVAAVTLTVPVVGRVHIVAHLDSQTKQNSFQTLLKVKSVC